MNREEVLQIEKEYPKGTRIELIEMKGEPDFVSGLRGVVDFVDGIGQLHMIWDNGRTLALIPGEDRFKVVCQHERRIHNRTEG